MQRSWRELELRYLEAIEYMPEQVTLLTAMAGLCKWIRKDEIGTSLFGQASMHTLSVSQSKFDFPIHHSIQYLRIDPLFKSQNIEFKFIDTHNESKQWTRNEKPSADNLIKRLNSFTKQIHWR
jgi:hypothetical protein